MTDKPTEDSYQETTNKTQLMQALRACVHGVRNRIEAHHSHGTTKMTIGPCPDLTEEQFECYLGRKVANVRRSPAYVWQ